MGNRAVIQLNLIKRNQSFDLDVPLDITAAELLEGVSAAYDLGIDTEDASLCYVKMENPVALLHGKKTLAEFGMHNSSIVNITE